MSDRLRASEYNERARLHQAADELEDAVDLYRQACAADPGWSVPWYNLGHLYKYQARWPESVRANTRATELDPDDVDAWWNLGIASTAIGEWEVARRAWRACGVQLPDDGTGPPELDLGMIAVRLHPDGEGEVVWAERIDPARARIVSVPLPESGHHEGDVVLHDGAVEGTRVVQGHEYPVFNVLEIWQRSPRSTFRAVLRMPSASDGEELRAICQRHGIVIEDWTATVRPICRQCSEGVPHERHTWTQVEWHSRRNVGLSSESAAVVRQALEEWRRNGSGRGFSSNDL